MSITLQQFEKIDGLYASILRMGNFETCADPRGYIQASNRLLDACIDAVGYDAACEFPSAEECAAAIVTRCLSSATLVMAA
ncbi:hypothetical protein [Sphingobium chungbukense]|uniref:Uncharacterized protein n=1 Tax=Sphingobium chungbukense TaxID=56193 RepID=A0A0M3AUP9_9SPHN|nr:hypothetical protein [Sphingobium chungbukense]KKW92656.1 hypothetical protein YP76_06890 [Sphingobium chungbukense]